MERVRNYFVSIIGIAWYWTRVFIISVTGGMVAVKLLEILGLIKFDM